MFKNPIESSFCYSLAWLAVVTPGIRKSNSVSKYILTFGKLFHTYKLFHIDQKHKILTVSVLLALLLKNWD